MELWCTNTLLLLSLLLLTRNLEALLQSENLPTPLLLLPIFLLLIQRAKQRVCWRSSSSRQDWQVSWETLQLICIHTAGLVQRSGLKVSTLFVFVSSCRFRGSYTAAESGSCTAAESYWGCRRGWSIICQCLSSQSVNPLLRPSLLLLSGPPQPRKPQTATPHCCHTQVTDFSSICTESKVTVLSKCLIPIRKKTLYLQI